MCIISYVFYTFFYASLFSTNYMYDYDSIHISKTIAMHIFFFYIYATIIFNFYFVTCIVPKWIYLDPRNMFSLCLLGLDSCLHKGFHSQYKHCSLPGWDCGGRLLFTVVSCRFHSFILNEAGAENPAIFTLHRNATLVCF